jgi:glycosyltransferase involved in cell wall biosynthesis
MHRVRQSLPYFELFGYQATVLAVLPEYVEMSQDVLLEKTIPNHIPVHKVTAYSTKYTRLFSLGNLGIRSFYQLYKKGNELLKSGDFDLVYFSTTAFSSMPLGPLWKRKFGVPFIIDMQDPWRNDYYLTVPKAEQPPKFWFAHRLNTWLESITIPKMDGLLSVSKGYVQMLNDRYPATSSIPSKVLTFGAAVRDYELLSNINIASSIELDSSKINIVYVGRGGHDMKESISLVFRTYKNLLDNHQILKECHFWFIGTSPTPDGEAKKAIELIANHYGMASNVTEISNRKPYFEVLSILQKSDIILIPGSKDENYTASKLYPNILAKKPLLCVVHSNSSMVTIVKDLNAGELVLFDKENAEEHCAKVLSDILGRIPFVPKTDWTKFDTFTAKHMTKEQCDFFDLVISKS